MDLETDFFSFKRNLKLNETNIIFFYVKYKRDENSSKLTTVGDFKRNKKLEKLF